jgi:MFS family permease
MVAGVEAEAQATGRAPAPRTPPAARPRAAFLGVFAACLPVFLGLGATVPVLPRYVKGPVGAGDLAVGVVTGAFALTAVLCRPLAGRRADVVGRRVIVIAGALFATLAGVLYFLPLGVPGLVLARLALGAGEGCVFTAGATWTVDLAPPDARGRAIGLFGLSIWSALAVGPLIGAGLQDAAGYHAVWAFAAVVPLVGAVVARALPDSPVRPGAAAGQRPWVTREALRPGASLALANLGYAAFAAFIVLHLERRGAGHGAAVFTAFAASVVGTRLLAGRLPDVVGPRQTAVGAAAMESAGLAIIALAHSTGTAVAGAVVMGFGFSVLYPSLALMVVDRVGEERRGAALGTFTAFFDVGIGLGAPIAGAIAAAAGYPAAFWAAAGAALLGGMVAAAGSARVQRAVADVGLLR